MKLFELPSEEKRIPSKSFLQKGNGEFLNWIHEPDFYICYRVGHDMRYATIIFGLITLSICLLYRFAGFFPNIINYPEQKDFLGLYLYLINFSGPVLTLSLIYYGLWFKKNVHFSEYNILRQDEDRKSEHEGLILFNLIFFAGLGVTCGIKPSVISSFFYMTIHGGFYHQYFDSTGMVLLVCGLIMIIHSMCFQALFKYGLCLLYIYRYPNALKKGLNK